jgi:HD-GYP domain-containing protein (c-di-GMP phosphodiesterase class II)
MAIVDREDIARAAEEVIRLIEVARKRAKIYPLHHPTVKEIVLRLLGAVEEILELRTVASFNIVQKEIFLDEILLTKATLTHTDFVEMCVSRAMSTLTFHAGVTGEELGTLVELLNERAAGRPAEHETALQEKLNEKGVEHIAVGALVSSSELSLLRGFRSPEEHEARKRRDQALELVWETYQNLFAGKVIDYESVELTVQGLVRGLLADRNVYRSLADIKDYHNYTFNHVVNVAILSLLVGADLGLTPEQLTGLGVAALLHDVGKLSVPGELLRKPGGLSDEEWKIMRQHPVEGARILLDQCGHQNIGVTVALEHHAHYDLSGYPTIVPARKLHLFSRIVSLSDVYDALTSDRSYRTGIMPDQAAGIILSARGKDFDPALAKHFIRSVGVYPRDCAVLLTNGELAIVEQPNPDDPLRPKVRLPHNDNKVLDLRETGIGIWKCVEAPENTRSEPSL